MHFFPRFQFDLKKHIPEKISTTHERDGESQGNVQNKHVLKVPLKFKELVQGLLSIILLVFL